MKNIVISNSFFLTSEYINNFSKDNNILPENIYYFDFDENEIGKAISFYLSNSIFDHKKVILLKNSKFLNKKGLGKNFELFFNDFLKSNSENHLFFQLENLKLKDSYYEKIAKDFSIMELTPKVKRSEFFLLEKYLKDINIKFEKKNINNVLRFANNNFEIAINEIRKILLVENDLTRDVSKYCIDLKGESFFKLLEAIIKKNYIYIKNIFNSALNKGISMILILESLLSDLEIIINIKLNEKLNEYSNFNELEIHPFRLNNLKLNSRNIDLKSSMFLYKNLLSFEESIKRNNPTYIDKLLYGQIFYLMKSI